MACSLTLLTLVIYLIIYTPLKKKSAYATEVGAISGALPPLIGWVALQENHLFMAGFYSVFYSLGNFPTSWQSLGILERITKLEDLNFTN